MRYLVTKEIESETQVVWKLYFRDFMFLVIWIAVNLYLKNKIHLYLQIPFCIFALIIGLVLVLPSNTNPKRREYQALAMFLMRKDGTFYYLRENDNEEERNKKHKRKSSGFKL